MGLCFGSHVSNYLDCFVEVDAKMSSFSITRKKTPFQKHREEEEAKKKVRNISYLIFVHVLILGFVFNHFLFLHLQRAEDETARLYAEFVESFQGENTPGSKAFVRGGLINPNEKAKAESDG